MLATGAGLEPQIDLECGGGARWRNCSVSRSRRVESAMATRAVRCCRQTIRASDCSQDIGRLSLDSLWREAVRNGIGLGRSWSLCTNGHQLRLIDTQRTYSRAYVQFDLEHAIESTATFQVFWGVLRSPSVPTAQDQALVRLRSFRRPHAMARRSTDRCRFGVIEAVQHLLTGLSRCGKRDARRSVRRIADGRVSRAVPDVRRSARPGSELASALPKELHHRVTAEIASNGPAASAVCGKRFRRSRGSHTAAVTRERSSCRRSMAGCSRLRALRSPNRARSTMRSRGRRCSGCRRPRCAMRAPRTKRRRHASTIATSASSSSEPCTKASSTMFPSVTSNATGGILLRRGGDRRKSTGSFYTPQSLTDYVVRRTLHPLVADAASDRILELRVVDPAMGSAAFLVSACRYLARAYERALIREERMPRGGPRRERSRRLQATDRAALSLRRRSESHCGSARATVSVARDAVGEQTAHISRSSSRVRRQSSRRLAGRRCAPASGLRRRPTRSLAAQTDAVVRGRRARAIAGARGRRAEMDGGNE